MIRLHTADTNLKLCRSDISSTDLAIFTEISSGSLVMRPGAESVPVREQSCSDTGHEHQARQGMEDCSLVISKKETGVE